MNYIARLNRPLLINDNIGLGDTYTLVYGIKFPNRYGIEIEEIESAVGYLAIMSLNSNGGKTPVKVITNSNNRHTYMSRDGKLHGRKERYITDIEQEAIRKLNLSYHLYVLTNDLDESINKDYCDGDYIINKDFFTVLENQINDDLPF